MDRERRAQEQRATTLRLAISLIKNYGLEDEAFRILERDRHRHKPSPVQQRITNIIAKPQLG